MSVVTQQCYLLCVCGNTTVLPFVCLWSHNSATFWLSVVTQQCYLLCVCGNTTVLPFVCLWSHNSVCVVTQGASFCVSIVTQHTTPGLSVVTPQAYPWFIFLQNLSIFKNLFFSPIALRYGCVYLCVCACVHAYMHVFMHACICSCMHAYVSVLYALNPESMYI